MNGNTNVWEATLEFSLLFSSLFSPFFFFPWAGNGRISCVVFQGVVSAHRRLFVQTAFEISVRYTVGLGNSYTCMYIRMCKLVKRYLYIM